MGVASVWERFPDDALRVRPEMQCAEGDAGASSRGVDAAGAPFQLVLREPCVRTPVRRVALVVLRHDGGCFGKLRGATGATFRGAPCQRHEHKALKTHHTFPDSLHTFAPPRHKGTPAHPGRSRSRRSRRLTEIARPRHRRTRIGHQLNPEKVPRLQDIRRDLPGKPLPVHLRCESSVRSMTRPYKCGLVVRPK